MSPLLEDERPIDLIARRECLPVARLMGAGSWQERSIAAPDMSCPFVEVGPYAVGVALMRIRA